MDESAFDFANARRHMVESQIRPNRVSDPRILAAMHSLPRERFLPERLAVRAYVDEDVPLGGGRVLMEPMVLARLLQLAAPSHGERALVVGAGSGYGAAVLASSGPAVTALEEDRQLLAIARTVLPRVAPLVTLIEGPLAAGWPPGAPWHIVLIEGAVRDIPAAISVQLSQDAGRLVTVLVRQGSAGQAVLATPGTGKGGLAVQSAFDCATPLLPPLVPAPVFTF